MEEQQIHAPARLAHSWTKMLHSPRLRWRTAFTYILVISLLMALLGIYLLRFAEARSMAALQTEYVNQTAATAAAAPIRTRWTQTDALQRAVIDLDPILGARGTAYDVESNVLADSRVAVADATILGVVPEVQAALADGSGVNVRIDPLTAQETIFVAHAVTDTGLADGRVLGVIRWAYPTTLHLQLMQDVRRALLWSLILATGAIALLLVAQSERSARTIRRLTAVSNRITRGQLDARIISYSSGEIGQLARAFNRMAGNLENQIRKSEQETDRLNTVMYVMTDGVIMVNRQGRVRLINAAASAMLNTNEETALQRSFVQVVRDHRIAEVWQRCRESGRQESGTIDFGADRFLQVVVTPFLRGADHGYLVMLQDLTRLRRLQTIRQDFVSNVSHELRTPLASLRALVETLRDGAMDDPPAAQRFLDRMEVEVDSLTQMVQELLELSRIESGQAPLKVQAVTVAEAIISGAERLRPQAQRAEVHLVFDIPAGLPRVLVDVDRIKQVITNLVHNAIKFTPPGGTITVSGRRHEIDDRKVVICVSDDGAGIPPEDLTRIFERFYKTDRARAGGGTGLGLAIAKHVVQAHRGEIWVESRPEQGSRFFFTLHMAPDQEQGGWSYSQTEGPSHQHPLN